MSALFRCMGGRFCSHAPGTCTATIEGESEGRVVLTIGGADRGTFIHQVLIPALRDAGIGANFHDEGNEQSAMILTGPNRIKVVELKR